MRDAQFTRRIVLRALLGGGLAAPFVAACGGASPAPPSPPPVKEVEKVVTQVVEKVVTQVVEKPVPVVVTATALPAAPMKGELTWWAWGSEQTGFPIWRKQIEIFNRKAPDVKVNVQPALSYDKVAVTMAAGTTADIIMINVPSGYAFIGKGHIINLQPFINIDRDWTKDLEQFNATTLESHKFRGELYAIPQSLETSGTIFNEDMIKEAGLTPPSELGDAWNWDKFAEYATRLTKGEGNEKIFGAYISPDPQSGLGDLAYPLGGKWVNDDGISTGVDTKEFIQATDFMVDLVVNKKVSPTPAAVTGTAASTAYALFVNQRVAMMISGDWAFGWIVTRQLPDKKFKLNWTVSPKAPNGKYAAVGHTVAQGGYAKTKQKDAVVAFMRSYATKESQSAITDGWENYPALAPRADSQDYFWKKGLIPNEKGIKASFAASQPYPRTPVADATIAVVTPVNNALSAILDGKDTRKPEVVLKELAQKINGDLTKAAQG
jgi:multiple sugar transport system substrate-binding protein